MSEELNNEIQNNDNVPVNALTDANINLNDKEIPQKEFENRKAIAKTIHHLERKTKKYTSIKDIAEEEAEHVTILQCKICNCEFREEAENMYANDISMRKIWFWLRDEKKFDIQYLAVQRHFNKHFKLQQQARDLLSLTHSLEKWEKVNQDDKSVLNRYVCALDREAMLLLAQNPDLDITEQRKNIELAAKVAQTIVSLKEMTKKMDENGEPIKIIMQNFNKFAEITIANTKNPEIKQALLQFMSGFVKELPKEITDIEIK